ncbi:hypothetical protein I4U23_026461 [Adineta vaga]|nr:hypothetical protein I4U23_026461 [Adineta vaga]
MSDQWQDETALKAQVVDDDEVLDSWETALEEKPKKSDVEEKPKVTAKSSKKKSDDSQKTIKQPDGDYTPDELDTIKQKEELKAEHDKLNMASDLVDPDGKHRSLDNLDLYTKDEFLNYSTRLYNHLKIVSNSEFYPDFIDNFLQGLAKSMSNEGVQRLSTTLQAITLRKQSDEREKKAKAKTKKQTKPQLRTGRQSDYGAFAVAAGDNDYDNDDYDDEDFM